MLRLKVWTRIAFLALVLATTTAWVTITVAPAQASASGSKSYDPSGDPGTGGGSNVGDPDGPTGDIGPADGTMHGHAGVYGTGVQAPTVTVAGPTRLSLWARFRIALGSWLRFSFLHL